jgi:hypothetical protein
LTSTIESDGISLMKARKSRKKKAKLPAMMVVSVTVGT